MVKILVTGASGYIGRATALALRSQGHTVFGLVRGAEQAADLAKNEIIPVQGDMSDSKTYADAVNKVTVVIDTTMVVGADMAKTNRDLLLFVADSAKATGVKKRFVYTSGCLVYGDYPNQLLDEDTPAKSVLGKWRLDFEQEILRNSGVEGVVLRPGFVYGQSFGRYFDFFGTPNDKGEIEVRGNPKRSWSFVHVGDLARAFVAVAEAPGSVVTGQIFNVADYTRLTVEEAQTAFSRAAGVKGPVVYAQIPADDYFGNFANVSTVLDCSKLRRLVGWTPYHNFADDIELYAATWLAQRKK